MPSKKRRRGERPSIHPRNKYSENPPDFDFLASLYPSFKTHVFHSADGLPRIDWTDFNATRELTRVLLLHDHGLNWWIPDGQLCPTVPNRSNYIHWIEDLLTSEIIPKNNVARGNIRGFDIGTGTNCIYPLLGASLLGWSFVGSDVTNVALDWAEKNVKSNPHIAELIEIRKVGCTQQKFPEEELHNDQLVNCEGKSSEGTICEGESAPVSIPEMNLSEKNVRPLVLLGVVKDGESFDFCMCNPPFFHSIEEAGLNPKTSCGGTPEEMVCPGGELAFITYIIEDSVVLKQKFRWYTSMVGRKANLKTLVSKLWEVGATIVKTTEFVQGQTCRWGLAWSFVPPVKKITSTHVVEKSNLSFMLEGLQRQFGALHVLQEVESFFVTSGVSCRSNATAFTVDIVASEDYCNTILKNGFHGSDGASTSNQMHQKSEDQMLTSSNELRLRISVFQQIPGTLLVKGSVQHCQNPVPGSFSLAFQQLEGVLKTKFCRGIRK